MNEQCVVAFCQRKRLSPRNGVIFATCLGHLRVDMAPTDATPLWVRRMQAKGLPPKDYTAA